MAMAEGLEFQVLLLQEGTDLVAVSRAGQLVDSIFTTMDFRVPADFNNSTAPAGHNMNNTVPAAWIEESMILPPGFINNIPTGSREFFANQANLRYNDKGPLTAAVHIQLGVQGTTAYNIIVGGKKILAKFPLKNFLSLEDRDNGADGAEVTFTLNPEAIEFPVNRSVSDWKPITTMFPDTHITEGANVRWDTRQVLVRLRLRANMSPDSSSKPVLLLEALILPTGTWEGVADPKKKLLASNKSSAIRLWSQDCSWYSPLPQHKLPTVSGLMRLSLDTVMPGEIKFRWTLQTILRRCDNGRSVESKQEFEAYLEKPYQTVTTTTTAYWLPYPFGIVDSLNYDQDVGPDGGPPALTPQEVQNNLRAVHTLNDSTKHPAQTGPFNRGPTVPRPQQQSLTTGRPQPSQSRPEDTVHLNKAVVPGPGHVHLNQFVVPGAGHSQPHQINPTATSVQNQMFQDQEVTQYCPIPACPYVSFRTYDTTLLAVCFEQIKTHLKVDHGVCDSTDSLGTTTRDKTSREYQAATRPRTITNVLDDATSNLCEARFFPFPLDMKMLGRNMPTAISPINTVVDLSHFGVDVTNPEVLKKLHNRANNNLRLKEFSDTNLRNFHIAGDMMVAVQATKDNLELGKKQKQLEDPKECIKAFFNFSALSRNYHPLDWSPMALTKVALEKFLKGGATVDQYIKLFEKFVHENSVRAQRKAVPLTYQEVLGIWTTFISTNPDFNTSSIEAVVDSRLNKQLKAMQTNNNRGWTGAVNIPVKRQRLTRDDYCPTWNKITVRPFCSNPQIQRGCTDPSSGKSLKHACNFKENNKFCNSDQHNYHTH